MTFSSVWQACGMHALGRSVRRLGMLLVLLGAATAASAQDLAPGYPDDFMALDAREVRLLPPYCIYSQYFSWKYRPDEEEKKRWEVALGRTFIAIHHYCFGLMKTHRALFLTKTKQNRDYYLRDSLKEFDYVIERAPDDFVLLPEILTKKGENLVRLGRGSFAVFDFERAATLNPKFWPPYAHLADYYKSTGEMDKAREVLNKGMQRAEETKQLERRLAELNQPVARHP